MTNFFKAGEKYGTLTLIEFSHKGNRNVQFWKAKCDCGNILTRVASDIKRGKSKCPDCLCVYKAGAKYNKLTFIEYRSKTKENNAIWLCQCDCGNTKEIRAHRVKTGKTKSCGCIDNAIDINRKKGEQTTEIETYFQNAKCVFRAGYKDGNLLFEEFYRLSQMNCFYCGAYPVSKFHVAYKNDKTVKRNLWREKNNKKTNFAYKKHPNSYFYYNGLDRIDSSLPHDKNNVIPCCKRCNISKMDATFYEFLLKIKQIYEHCELNLEIPKRNIFLGKNILFNNLYQKIEPETKEVFERQLIREYNKLLDISPRVYSSELEKYTEENLFACRYTPPDKIVDDACLTTSPDCAKKMEESPPTTEENPVKFNIQILKEVIDPIEQTDPFDKHY